MENRTLRCVRQRSYGMRRTCTVSCIAVGDDDNGASFPRHYRPGLSTPHRSASRSAPQVSLFFYYFLYCFALFCHKCRFWNLNQVFVVAKHKLYHYAKAICCAIMLNQIIFIVLCYSKITFTWVSRPIH